MSEVALHVDGATKMKHSSYNHFWQTEHCTYSSPGNDSDQSPSHIGHFFRSSEAARSNLAIFPFFHPFWFVGRFLLLTGFFLAFEGLSPWSIDIVYKGLFVKGTCCNLIFFNSSSLGWMNFLNAGELTLVRVVWTSPCTIGNIGGIEVVEGDSSLEFFMVRTLCWRLVTGHP